MPFQRCPIEGDLPERWRLSVGAVDATVVPAAGMNLVSLVVDGTDHLSLPLPLPEFVRTLKTGGVPLLHPWANRLRDDRWRFDGVEVDAGAVADLKRDAAGLPMHGLLLREQDWVVRPEGGEGLVGRLEFGESHPAFAAFPFPHRVEVAWTVRTSAETAATARCRLRIAAGDRDVPIASGWHPYLRPSTGVDPRAVEISTPPVRRVRLDARGLPLRDEGGGLDLEAPTSIDGALAGRTFDDLFAVEEAGWTASVAAAGVRVSLVADSNWSWLQVFTPGTGDAVCLEPMLAPTAALCDGAARRIGAGTEFEACFEIRIESAGVES